MAENEHDSIPVSQAGFYFKTMKQKHAAFQRAGFVLPAFKSSIMSIDYLDKVSFTIGLRECSVAKAMCGFLLINR